MRRNRSSSSARLQSLEVEQLKNRLVRLFQNRQEHSGMLIPSFLSRPEQPRQLGVGGGVAGGRWSAQAQEPKAKHESVAGRKTAG